jgi:hypothetical protein
MKLIRDAVDLLDKPDLAAATEHQAGQSHSVKMRTGAA